MPTLGSQFDEFNEDDRWAQHHADAAERMFGVKHGGVLTPEQDEAAVAEANSRLAEDLANRHSPKREPIFGPKQAYFSHEIKEYKD